MTIIPVVAAAAVVCHRRRRREQEAQQMVIGTPAYAQMPMGVAPPSTTGAYPQQGYPVGYPMGGPGYPILEGSPVVGVPVGAQPVYGQTVQGVSMSTRDLRRAYKQERREDRREHRQERRALKAEIRAARHAGKDIRAGGFQPQTVYVQPSIDARTAQQFAFTEREDDAGFMVVDQHMTPPPPTAPTYVAPTMPMVYDPYVQASAPPVSTCAV